MWRWQWKLGCYWICHIDYLFELCAVKVFVFVFITVISIPLNWMGSSHWEHNCVFLPMKYQYPYAQTIQMPKYKSNNGNNTIEYPFFVSIRNRSWKQSRKNVIRKRFTAKWLLICRLLIFFGLFCFVLFAWNIYTQKVSVDKE